ncbi:hypothetical protein [Microbulbifer sp. ZKSA002]|uniref:hypothetical protein n=1 Tax=Microbulbifer sp. ZKSA002 TaxID=3243388 RepID=UPI0040390F11
MSQDLPPSAKGVPNLELPQWINCQERLPEQSDATARGYVRVIWKSTNSSNGVITRTWEVGMDHYENAHNYLGWMPISIIVESTETH